MLKNSYRNQYNLTKFLHSKALIYGTIEIIYNTIEWNYNLRRSYIGMTQDNLMIIIAFALYLGLMMYIGVYYYRKSNSMVITSSVADN